MNISKLIGPVAVVLSAFVLMGINCNPPPECPSTPAAISDAGVPVEIPEGCVYDPEACYVGAEPIQPCPGEAVNFSTPVGRHAIVGRARVESTTTMHESQVMCGCVQPGGVFTARLPRTTVTVARQRCDNLQESCLQTPQVVGTIETAIESFAHYASALIGNTTVLGLYSGCGAGLPVDAPGFKQTNICSVRIRKSIPAGFFSDCDQRLERCLHTVVFDHIHSDSTTLGMLEADQFSPETHDRIQVLADTRRLRAEGDAWPAMTSCLINLHRRRFNLRVDDDDGDQVCGILDNCGNNVNFDQADNDGDGKGDVCDADDDNDGLLDERELANGVDLDPFDPDTDDDTISDRHEAGDAGDAPDSDGDGIRDGRDEDSDNDGIPDVDEAGDSNLSTAPVDTDSDGHPDFRDDDSDNDGVLDGSDNCRTLANADQLNSDGQADGGDSCDDDDDDDGVADGNDNCPRDSDPVQMDTDGDGVGDACDISITMDVPAADVDLLPGPDNQWVFGSLADLRILPPLFASTSGPAFNPQRDTIAWTFASPDETHITWTPPHPSPPDPQVPTGGGDSPTLEINPQNGELPWNNTTYGQHVLQVAVYRDGRLTDRVRRKIRIYWPATIAQRSGWSLLDDTHYAKNHSEPDQTVLAVHANRQFFSHGIRVSLLPRRIPNWLVFWRVFSGNLFNDELSSLSLRYTVFSPNMGYALFAASAFFVESIGSPNNTLYFGDLASAQVEDQSGNSTSVMGIRGFHLTVAHESCHLRQYLRWSTLSRSRHLDADDPSRIPVVAGMPVHPMDWSWGLRATDLASTTFVDLDGDGIYTKGLQCDLNSDGQLGLIRESQIVDNPICGGFVINGLPDFDGSPDSDALIFERDLENLDSDGDNLPNSEDLPQGNTVETECDIVESVEYEVCNVDPNCRLNQLRDYDWAAPGENH